MVKYLHLQQNPGWSAGPPLQKKPGGQDTWANGLQVGGLPISLKYLPYGHLRYSGVWGWSKIKPKQIKFTRSYIYKTRTLFACQEFR